jgi:Zn-dependent protease
MTDLYRFLFQLIILIFSVMIHEIAHGAVALAYGDDTAKRDNRLNLNPINHIDPFGSIILPLILAIPALFGMKPILIGWAKPVPVDLRKVKAKNLRKASAMISFAGPLSNLLIAFIFVGALTFTISAPLSAPINQTFLSIAVINIILAVFNLIPIPPLDGSKILSYLLPISFRSFEGFLEHFSLPLLLALILFGDGIIRFLLGSVLRLFFWVFQLPLS